MQTEPTWANTEKITSLIHQVSGRNFSSNPEIWVIPYLIPNMQKWASIYAMTGHFPDGARILGLNGAEIVYNPSATVAGLSQYLWELEQPAHAAANGYFMGCINRVGTEAPWNLGHFLWELLFR